MCTYPKKKNIKTKYVSSTITFITPTVINIGYKHES